MPIEAELATLITEIDANLSHVDSIVHGLSHGQFNWRPAPGRWSVGECIAHLNVTNAGDLKPIEGAIARGRAANMKGQGPFTYGSLSRKFVASQEPPIKKKFKAPKSFIPPPEVKIDEAVAEYRRIRKELRKLTQGADGLHLAKIKVELPALPAPFRWFVKMPLGARLALITTHDRRHLWQAEQVKADPAFPET
jgi:hypothetical protein